MSDLERNAADELLFATGRLVGEDDQLLQETAERLARGESVDLDALRERPTLSDEELNGIGELAAPLDDAFIGALTRSIAGEEDGAASRVPSSADVAASTSEPAGAQVISLASRRARTGWIAGSLSAAAAAALLWWTGGGVVDGPADAGTGSSSRTRPRRSVGATARSSRASPAPRLSSRRTRACSGSSVQNRRCRAP